VVFVRDRKRHAIASLNTGSLCSSEWILPNCTTEPCAYFSRSVYSYLVLVLALWGIWVSGRSDQSFCANTEHLFSRPSPIFPLLVLHFARNARGMEFNGHRAPCWLVDFGLPDLVS
jgi:hypothetical protein